MVLESGLKESHESFCIKFGILSRYRIPINTMNKTFCSCFNWLKDIMLSYKVDYTNSIRILPTETIIVFTTNFKWPFFALVNLKFFFIILMVTVSSKWIVRTLFSLLNCRVSLNKFILFRVELQRHQLSFCVSFIFISFTNFRNE